MDDEPATDRDGGDRTADGAPASAVTGRGAVTETTDATDAVDAADATDAAAAGPFDEPIEPESVNPEHAAFVILGVALTLVVVVSVL